MNRVDLVEGELGGTVAALQLEEWRNDMDDEIDSINRILPNTWAGEYGDDGEGRFFWDGGEKAEVIRTWIRSVLQKIVHYKAEHRRILSEAATAIQLQFDLPHDIITNNVLPFLALPSRTFDGENHVEGEAVNSVNEGGAEDEKDDHEEGQGDHNHDKDNDFGGNGEEEVKVGNEDYDEHGSGREKRQRR